MNIKKFVLTGGPCAGKTTGLTKIKEFCEAKQIFLIVIPEIARLYISSGIDPRVLKDAKQNRLIQKNIIATQIEWEFSAMSYAKMMCKESGKRGLVICDRGVCDNGAYMGRIEYREALDFVYKTPQTALQSYDAVFHLQSAAVGAAEHYKTDPVRTDTPEQAVKLDNLTMMQWDTHPRFHLIPNPQTGFEGKMQILIEHLDEELGKNNDGSRPSI